MNYTEKGSLILDGRDVAKKIQASLKEEIQKKNVKITLATVLVGDDGPSKLYVNNKHKQAQSAGIESVMVSLAADITQKDLEKKIIELGNDVSINGILVQMPLPKGLDEDRVIELIPENKDVIFNPDPRRQMQELSKFMGYDVRMISPDFGNA